MDRSEVGLWFAKEPLKKFHFRTPINERQHVNGKLVRGAIPDAADVEAGRVSQGATPTTISSFSGLPPIPPYMADYTVTSELAITQDITINGFYPHMHVRGKVAEYQVVYPDGREQLLFEVPRYRFDWQERYVLAQPLKIPKGSLLKYKGVFDNSADNPLNPEPRQGSVLVRTELGRDEPRLDRIHARQAAVERARSVECVRCVECVRAAVPRVPGGAAPGPSRADASAHRAAERADAESRPPDPPRR